MSNELIRDDKWCEAVLAYDMFAGDFGEPGDSVLSNHVRRVRKPAPCHECGETAERGTLARRLTMRWGEDGLMSYTVCQTCCDLYAMDETKCEHGDHCGDCPYPDELLEVRRAKREQEK